MKLTGGLTKNEKAKFAFGFFRVAFERQRGYAAWATPILLAGLYGKEKIIHFIQTYWYLIPLWIGWIFFDMLVLLPGEQIFYAKSNRLFMDIHRDIKHE
jgi:hypothetical protein